MSGPGVRLSASTAAMKRARVDESGIIDRTPRGALELRIVRYALLLRCTRAITVRHSIFMAPPWNITVPLIILSLMKAMLLSMAVLLFLLTGPALVVAMGTVTLGGHWSTASRQSSHQA